MVTQTYTISTVKNAVPPKVKMSQYDTGSRTIVFSVVDGSGTAVDLTGLSVTVEGTRIDGHAFASACTVDDNTATFTESVDMTNVAGDHPAELVIRDGGDRLGTMNFVISVEPCAMDEGANLTNEDLPLYQQLFKGLAGAPMIYNSASGSVASFPDGADGYPLKSLTVAVEPKQSGSGDPSPSNIRPISGWDEIKITRVGKNLLESDDLIKTTNNVFIKNANGSYTFTHVGTGLANRSSGKASVHLASGQTVSVSFKYSGTISSALSIRFEATDGAYTDYANLSLQNGVASCTLTLTKDAVGAEFYFGSGGVGETLTLTDIQIEVGSATDYEPYTAKEYTISIGETVYGGTLDVVGGKMVVTDGNIASYNGEALPGEWISDRDVYTSGTTPTTGAQVVYKLATPVEITLTPQQITTLLGGNNVWADAGAVSVEYPCDTKLYITNAIAAALATV